MKNIAVAIEFDEELDDIISFTTDLVSGKDTTVHVVHAYQSHSELAEYAPHLVDSIHEYEEELHKQAETVRGIVSRLTARNVKAHGYMKPIDRNIAHSIMEFAEKEEAELIVMGSHHPGRVERLLLGSVSEDIVRHSSIPVAVVPRNKRD